MRFILPLILLCAATPGFAQSAPPAPPSCESDPLFRQLDFTIGSWDVTRNGEKNAEVHMERALNGCAIIERWVKPGATTGNGSGLFTYSRILNAWTYAWASDVGAATFFTAHLIAPGEMRFDTERPLPTGGKRIRRWTLSLQPDGRVRELSIGSDDAGKIWTTEYDLMWAKKPS